MKWLIKILNNRTATILCLLFAILNRIIFCLFYTTISRDTRVQLTYAENLINGKGMGVTKYFTTDLVTPVFDTYQLFPPGYSLSIAPFLWITGNNEQTSVLTFEIISAVLFIVSVCYLTFRIGLSSWLTNIMILFAGCSQYPFFLSSSPTDVISLSLVLFGIGASIGIIKAEKMLTILQLLCYGILFTIPSFYRYMYIPVSIIFPIIIIYSGIVFPNKVVRNNGIKLLLITTGLILLFLSFSFISSGNAMHIYNTERGIYPDQVIRWYPFIPASFINLDFAIQQISIITGIAYSTIMFMAEILNGLLLVLFLFLLFRFLFFKSKSKISLQGFIFITSGSAISLSILLMLAYLSLTYEKQDWGEFSWTYSYDIRYFAFIYVFIPLLLFYFINKLKTLKKNSFFIASIIALLLLSTEAMHGFYFNMKIILKSSSLNRLKNRDQDYKSFPLVLERIHKSYPDRLIYVCGPDQYYSHTASVMGYRALFDYKNLGNTTLYPPEKSILLVPVHSQDAWIMKDYVEKNHPEIVDSVSGTVFYLQELLPG